MGANYLCCKRTKDEENPKQETPNLLEKNLNNSLLKVKEEKKAKQPEIKITSKHIKIVEKTNQNEIFHESLKNMVLDDFNNKSTTRELLTCLKELLNFNTTNKEIKSNIFLFVNEDNLFYNERENYFYCAYQSKNAIT